MPLVNPRAMQGGDEAFQLLRNPAGNPFHHPREGCADEEILLSSCGLKPPPTAPPRQSPPRPAEPKKSPTHKHKSFELSSNSSSDQTLPRGHGKVVKGKQPQQQKRHEEPPSLEGHESRDPLLGAQVFVPYTDGVYPGVVISVGGGAGGGGGGTPRGKGDVSG